MYQMTYDQIAMLISMARETKDKDLEKRLKEILTKKLENEKKILDNVDFS